MNGFEFRPTISNYLIGLSLIWTILFWANANIQEYWMNSFFYLRWDYIHLAIQYLMFEFLHWWFLHFASNSIFILIYWNILEEWLWKRMYLLFFLLNIPIVGSAILFFSNWNTIWISWFAMAILAFMFAHLRKRWSEDAKWAWFLLVLNLVIWINSWISFIWHLSWAIYWIFAYMILDYLNLIKRF